MNERISWVAVCQYPGRPKFGFYSPAFVVNHWSDLEAEAARIVAQAWAEISPHPAPPVVDYLPGIMEYVPHRKDGTP